MKMAVGLALLVTVAVLDGITGLSEPQISNENQNGGNGGNDLDLDRLSGSPRNRICEEGLGGKCFKKGTSCPGDLPEEKPFGKPHCNKKNHRCCYPVEECVPDITCEILGGYCQHKANPILCPGKLFAGGCSGKGCQCCVPGQPQLIQYITGCPAGYIWYPLSNQCFKVVQQHLTWDDANQTCSDMGPGHGLAKPYDPVSLRSYLAIRYGLSKFLWLDARGDGSQMVWQRDQTKIESKSPLWFPEQPRGVTSDDCLELLTTETWWNRSLSQPYFTVNCNDGRDRYTLCELYLD